MSSKYERFVRTVFEHYRLHGRHALPWRKTKDPYRILVSEVMLQQTQVERVIPYYKAWCKKFPTAKALAHAPLKDVLVMWQGLGYNRRAKNLQTACKELSKKASFPRTVEELEKLSGIGPYTARAVASFAYNQPVVMVETNIRTVILHHFFKHKNQVKNGGVSDTEIEEILEKVLPQGKSREWYWALMDYGASLKHSGVTHTAKMKAYSKQSVFKGSSREARGALIKALAKSSHSESKLLLILGKERKIQVRTQLTALVKEGMVVKKRGMYMLPS